MSAIVRLRQPVHSLDDTIHLDIIPFAAALPPRPDIPRAVISRWGHSSTIFSLQKLRLTTALLVISPRVLYQDQIYELIWGDDSAGGPLNTAKILHIHIHHLRNRLYRLGLQIITHHGMGYSVRILPDSHHRRNLHRGRGTRVWPHAGLSDALPTPASSEMPSSPKPQSPPTDRSAP